MAEDLPAALLPAEESRALPALMLIVQGVFFGAMIGMNRIAVGGGIPPLGYAFWQCLGAAVLLLLGGLATGRVPRVDWASTLFYLVVGGLGLAIPWGLLAVIAPHLPAGVVTLVLGLIPAATYGLALLVGMAALRLMSIAGLGLGFAGLLLIVLPEGSLPEPGMGSWVAVLVASVFASACSNIIAERFQPAAGSSSLALAGGTMMGAAFVLLLIVVASGQFYPLPPRIETRDAALLVSIAIAALNLFLFFEVIRRAGAVFVSQFNYIVVPSGIIWGMILFGERLSVWLWLAIPLMLAGVGLVNAANRRRHGEPRNPSVEQPLR